MYVKVRGQLSWSQLSVPHVGLTSGPQAWWQVLFLIHSNRHSNKFNRFLLIRQVPLTATPSPETGFLCVALAVLELREIRLPLPPKCWD